jgi:8-oxo-dGTP pyrophosphatase MutT (NUDIX family)
MSERITHKVSMFITRKTSRGSELLLFTHPYAGVQIPAGTAKRGEDPGDAALREVGEETGLRDLCIKEYLGSHREELPPDKAVIYSPTHVYARADETSFDWAYLPAGIMVTIRRSAKGFSQITYTEYDRVPDPEYVSMEITGWVPDDTIADAVQRHFFHMRCDTETGEEWQVYADNHTFRLFWAPMNKLPEIIYPQNTWLRYLEKVFPN